MRESHIRVVRGWVAVALLATAVLAPKAVASQFTVPPALRPQVDFWVNVFATYGRRQIVIHDTERLDRIYTVLDFEELDRQGLTEVQIELAMKAEEDAEKARLAGVLRRLDAIDPRSPYLTEEERRIVALFAGDRTPGRFSAAAERLRGQRGLRERFARGIQVAHAYFPEMERIFREEGVPVEITRLPLVESCFNVRAYSKVGAAGVWQFMPATARNYMRVDGTVDERLDPLVATRAAARFMRQNYNRLGSWPLAIKAYNHGPAGIARAVRETGSTDPVVIIQQYRGPAYKFASRNFYPEFLAALHVERNYRHYFGDLPLDPPLRTATVGVPQATSITAAARCAGVDTWDIASLNPSLLASVRSGRRPIPRGFSLRVPPGAAERAARCLEALPAARVQQARRGSSSRRASVERAGKQRAKRAAVRPKKRSITHRVKRGQTLSHIATLYGCSVEQIRRGNKLKSNKIQAGQVLRIPVS